MAFGESLRWVVLLVGASALLPHCVESGDAPTDDAAAGEAGAAGEGPHNGGSSANAGTPNGGGKSGSAGTPSTPAAGTAGHANAGAGAGGDAGASTRGDAGAGGDAGAHAGGNGSAGDDGANAGSGGNGDDPVTPGPVCEPVGQYCNTENDCDYFSGCIGQQCVPIAEGTPCGPAPCGRAQYCLEGACKNYSIAVYGDCTPDYTVCPQGETCYWRSPIHGSYEYQCTDPKTNTNFCDYGLIPCADGYYCPTFQGSEEFSDPPFCVKRAQVGEPCMDEEPYSCAPGLSCNFYKCQAPGALGAPCEPYVSSWDDPALRREYDNRFALPCQAGLYCQFVNYGEVYYSEGVCAAQLPLGGLDCEGNFVCQEGLYCDGAGKCVKPTLGSVCGFPGICPTGTVCFPPGRHSGSECVPELADGDQCGYDVPGGFPGACKSGSECRYDPLRKKSFCRAIADVGESCSEALCEKGSVCIVPATD